jgi:catechol 2,3-dioxygenase-like lactoylglutathione lyase family enzyme
MKLNHINLPVEDVAATKRFFEKFFDFECLEVKGDNALAILKGEGNFILVLMSKSFNQNRLIEYPDAFHIGFLVNGNDKVDAAHQRLIEGGFLPQNPPGSIRGQYGFYFKAPGNLLIEVTTC